VLHLKSLSMVKVRGGARLAFCFIALTFVAALSGDTAATPRAFRQTAASTPPEHLAVIPSDAEIELFLQRGKVTKTRGTEKGITNSVRATMFDGVLTHDAHIQTVDEYKREFRTIQGVEFDFRDSWMFNVAAYKLDRLIGLNMVPVSVAGRFRSAPAAITWWVDDVLMDEGGRVKKQALTPDPVKWSRQTHMLHLFDQLIYNTDRNLENLLISKDWRIWAIDHTRAFRKQTSLKSPAVVIQCDRAVFERLKTLDRDGLKRELGKFLDDGQIRAILARRDAIVAKLESLGPGALFDRVVRTSQ
jgi:hypothetical protein